MHYRAQKAAAFVLMHSTAKNLLRPFWNDASRVPVISGWPAPYVRTGSSASSPTLILWCTAGVGPILFLLYTTDLIPLIQSHSLCPHLYADDTQIYVFCRPAASLELQNNITSCVDDVASWMRSNPLQLNAAKTEILWSATSRRSHQLPQLPLQVGDEEVMPATVVRDLGIYIDADVSMRSHVMKTISGCFAVLRQLRSVRRSVSRSVFQ